MKGDTRKIIWSSCSCPSEAWWIMWGSCPYLPALPCKQSHTPASIYHTTRTDSSLHYLFVFIRSCVHHLGSVAMLWYCVCVPVLCNVFVCWLCDIFSKIIYLIVCEFACSYPCVLVSALCVVLCRSYSMFERCKFIIRFVPCFIFSVWVC